MADILSIVKTLLDISGDEHDNILNLYVSTVTQQVKNYCNIHEIPKELVYTVAQMVVDVFNESTQEGKAAAVASVSEAGRTVSFNSVLVQSATERKIAERKTQLNRFRLLYRDCNCRA